MTTDKNEENRTGVILVATYFILIATWFFANTSFSGTTNSIFSIFWTIFGTYFIVVGWAILNTKSWAYYTALITCIISMIFAFFFIIFSPIYLLILFLFVAAAIVLFYYRNMYIRDEQKTSAYPRYEPSQGRRCTNCGRPIPFDAILCPYCGKKFKNYLDKK